MESSAPRKWSHVLVLMMAGAGALLLIFVAIPWLGGGLVAVRMVGEGQVLAASGMGPVAGLQVALRSSEESALRQDFVPGDPAAGQTDVDGRFSLVVTLKREGFGLRPTDGGIRRLWLAIETEQGERVVTAIDTSHWIPWRSGEDPPVNPLPEVLLDGR